MLTRFNDIFRTYQQYMGALSYALFMLLVFLLPFPWHFAQPIATIWLIACALEFRWLQRYNYSRTSSLMPLGLIILLIVWEMLSLLWSGNIAQGWKDAARLIPIGAVILLSLSGFNKHYNTLQIKKTLIIGSLAAIMCYLMIIYWYRQMGHLTKVPAGFWWSFLGEGPLAVIKHRFYFCLVMMLALGFSVDIYKHYSTTYSRLSAALTISIADVILIAAIVLTGSRTMMLLIPLLAVTVFFIHYKGRYRMLFAVVVALVFLGFLGWGFRHLERLKYLKNDVVVIHDSKGDITSVREPRVFIWKTIFYNTKDFGMIGMGAGTSTDYLVQQYEKAGYKEYANNRFGAHSQYLNTWMELGPVALLLMLCVLILSVYCHSGQARRSAYIICLLFGVGLLTETALLRMSGVFTMMVAIVLIEKEQRDTDCALPDRPQTFELA